MHPPYGLNVIEAVFIDSSMAVIVDPMNSLIIARGFVMPLVLVRRFTTFDRYLLLWKSVKISSDAGFGFRMFM